MAMSDEIDLLGLDDNFEPVCYINFINLQWNRRYYEVGTWTAQILADDYDDRVKYVYAHQRPELGLVERMETQHDIKGDFVLLSGRFFESVLSWKLAYPHFEGEYTLPALSERMIQHNWYRVRKYDIFVSSEIPDTTVDIKWENDPLGERMYDTLKTLEMSQSVLFDAENNSLTYNIWKGKDRTQEQTENAFALFSDDSSYVVSFKYTEDWSNFKNVCMILYGDGPSRRDRYLEGWEEQGERWIVINSSEEEDKKIHEQEAYEELENYPIVREAEIDVVQDEDGLLYLVDYDIGDLCDIVNHKYQKSFKARLSGIDEVWKQGKHTVTLLFGEQVQTQYNRLRNLIAYDRKAH